MFQIGNYQCTSKIGEGSNSTVYSTQNQNTSEPLALKISKKKSSYENEKKILSVLNHEGIAKLIDSFQEGSNQVLVLEYGKDLFDHVIENGKFSEKDAKKQFKPIFEAVNYLHKNKIIHRDIKLENIIMTEKHELKMIDFDLAYQNKLDDSINNNNKMSNKNTSIRLNPCGTFQYAAPEILKNFDYDSKIDVWALGITLFAAVFGAFPFDGDDLYSYTFSALTKNPDFDFDDIKVSKDFIDLIKKMLEKNPAKRITINECLNHSWFNS